MPHMAAAQWFKGNLHIHSLWSDGQQFPELAADWFKSNGYHFIAFTEHDQLQTGDRYVGAIRQISPGELIVAADLIAACESRFGPSWVQRRGDEVRLRRLDEYRHLLEEPGRFLIMTGEEITTKTADSTHYINAYNLDRAVPAQSHAAPSSNVIDTVVRAAEIAGSNVLVSFNHPNWMFNATAEDLAATESLGCMEMYTALNSCITHGDDRHVSAERVWDIVLALRLARGGKIMRAMASDDCHAYTLINRGQGKAAMPGRAWVQVRAAELSPRAILDAMHRGDFYNSTGVELADVQHTSDSLHVAVKPAAGVRYSIQFIGTKRDCPLDSQPVLDEHGSTLRATRQYSPQLGQVLATVHSPQATYRFTGDERYVRARVTSDRYMANPPAGREYERAWTQAV